MGVVKKQHYWHKPASVTATQDQVQQAGQSLFICLGFFKGALLALLWLFVGWACGVDTFLCHRYCVLESVPCHFIKARVVDTLLAGL